MNEKSRSFEQAMGRLEQIVRAMERGDVPLEQSLQLFEEGTGLVRQCGKLLEEAEMKISKVAKGADGEPTETEFVENG
ncbi:MAG: exodeoxyribonuclease VII small subunit [Oscillospiraceae bacterium]|nr:exodeoxyribonuclease VII small subunit [Oscillospiraceae bacterium]